MAKDKIKSEATDVASPRPRKNGQLEQDNMEHPTLCLAHSGLF